MRRGPHPGSDVDERKLAASVDQEHVRVVRVAQPVAHDPGSDEVDAIVEEAIYTTRKSIEGGETIAAPLAQTAVFPPMVVQMIGVGEATGALDTMLGKIADFYEEEVDQAVANLLPLMEPVMILFLGVSVGGIIVAMYLPLFDLISKLS